MTSYAAQLSCASCAATNGISRTCSACRQLCCTICSREPADQISMFNAPSVLCQNCLDSSADTATLGHCELHPGRILDLYCLTCNMQICADCFIMVAEHKRHTIDSVETIYRQKLLETVEKFCEISRRLKQIDLSAVWQVNENLKIVEEVEKQILTEVCQLVQERTASLVRLTAEKKEILNRTKDVINRAKMQQLETMKEIDELNSSDFLRSQESLNVRCGQILRDIEQLHVQPVLWDDIQCDLIPVCKMQTIFLNLRPDSTLEGQQISVHLIDDCGIQWTVLFYVESLTISSEIFPTQKVLDGFQFRAMVEISHTTRLKVSGASFIFGGRMERSQLISIKHLQCTGLLSDEGILKLRIGIRLENIVGENKLLKALLLEEQNANSHLKIEQATLKEQNLILQQEIAHVRFSACQSIASYEKIMTSLSKENKELKEASVERSATPNSQGSSPTYEDKQKLISDMKRLQVKLDAMKCSMKSMNPYAIGSFEIYRFSKETKFYSPHLTTYNGITIYVVIQPNFFSDNASTVNANVCWAKGPKKNCEVFIEIINEYEKDCVREDRVFDFTKGTSFTWRNVISHFALFNGKGGFLADDNLKIKFGLRPKLD
ncbi:uncharacterized protein LOC128740860 [Sabethes cyaneus]|uniref:uncharacterized protein LOC128740860 n=1 Tax=Sabethes cyaneus TaxID=53552 RepID=UPI00237E31C4|nr:uncharacterized protein LOC128740860 [Sabethes cyaneus]